MTRVSLEYVCLVSLELVFKYPGTSYIGSFYQSGMGMGLIVQDAHGLE